MSAIASRGLGRCGVSVPLHDRGEHVVGVCCARDGPLRCYFAVPAGRKVSRYSNASDGMQSCSSNSWLGAQV